MSTEFLQNSYELLSDEQKVFLSGFINLNQKDLVINFDLDGVLCKTEIAVLDYVDHDLGTNFSSRKMKGFDPIAKWLVEDGIMNSKDAGEYENDIWDNPKIIKLAPPNEKLRAFSHAAYMRKILQFVTTSRPAELYQITGDWLKFYFDWIVPENINVRTGNNLKGFEFKAKSTSLIYRRYPEMVTIDDSLPHIQRISELCPDIGIIGFPYEDDPVPDIAGNNKVFIPLATFEDLLYYSDINLKKSKMF